MANYGYMCPTPKEFCAAPLAKLNAGLDKKGIKKHGTRKEAMQCYAHYLVNHKNCTKLSKREFKHPNGPIEVLSRESQFGCELRAGKRGDNMAASDRGMPKAHAAITSS